MFYRRAVLDRLEKELTRREATVITGMRQVGKTTLLKYLFSRVSSQNKALFDFENPLERKLFEAPDFARVLDNLADFGINKRERAFIFIDEIQNLPLISRVAKYLIDHYETKFFLTGSSSYYIRNLFPESMAGRKIITELFPLTFSEFLVFKGVGEATRKTDFAIAAKGKNEVRHIKRLPLYREYMTYGGFPAVVLEPRPAMKKTLLEGIFQSYFEKDVKTLSDLTDRSRLRDLILLLVPRIGARVEIEKIASQLGTTRATIYAYLKFLEDTYVLKLLPRFGKSIDRSRAGRRKLYFTDTGLARALGNISEGQMFENSIFQTLRPNAALTFYKAKHKEIDFIVNAKVALETKLTAGRRDIYELGLRTAALKLKEQHVVSLAWSPEEQVILATDMP